MDERAKPVVLIVDDTSTNIEVLRGILKDDYKIKVAINGDKALTIAYTSPPDLILLDIMMPGMDGYQVCKVLKENISTAKIPVIFVTAKGEVSDESKGFELGAVDYITKPISPSIVLARVRTHLALYNETRLLNNLVKERTDVINQTRLKIIHRLGRAAEFKDNETGLHVIRMSLYSKIIALASGMPEDEADILLNAAPMHDIGKIGIPDKVLLKPGKLDSEEWRIMQQHSKIGAEILGAPEPNSYLLNMAYDIALTHHEKWDGSGYPNGLKAEEISIHARIVMIADVFDALTSSRPYKDAWPVEKAVSVIEADAGSHFDPSLVAVFKRVLPEILAIKDRYCEVDS